MIWHQIAQQSFWWQQQFFKDGAANEKVSWPANTRRIAIRALQRNFYFARPENVLIAMLCDSDIDARRTDVNKIRAIRAAHDTTKIGSSLKQIHEGIASHSSKVRMFLLLTLNIKARPYWELTDLNHWTVTEPSYSITLSNEDLLKIYNTPLSLKHQLLDLKNEMGW